MGSNFSGVTAEHYANYRRDVPNALISQLVRHFGLTPADCVLDLGAGTGQMLVPLAREVGCAIGIEPEPDMLVRLRRRATAERVELIPILAAAQDLPAVQRLLGVGRLGLLTVVNALHWMDAEQVFAQARELLRPGGGLAVVNHGVPLWLADADWARAVNRFLQDWLGGHSGSACGLDDATQEGRSLLLRKAGFEPVTVLHHRYQTTLTPDYIVGHLYSTLSDAQVPPDRRSSFEQGLLTLLDRYDQSELVEDVPVSALVATVPA